MSKFLSLLLLQALLLSTSFAGEKGGNNLVSELSRELESSSYVFVGCYELLDRPEEEIIAICHELPVFRSDLARKNKEVKALLKCCPAVLR